MSVRRLVSVSSSCFRSMRQYRHHHHKNPLKNSNFFHRFVSSNSASSPPAPPPAANSIAMISPIQYPSANHNNNIIHDSDRYSTALSQNKEWAVKTSQENPDLFPTLATGQSPEILWIGCSDARCPETTLLGLKPGDVFVHRNIANVLHPADLSSSAVVEYAVAHLKVKHVVLCGHTGCGGVAAALGNKQLGILDPWLFPLRQIREDNLKALQSLSAEERALKLSELNVLSGVKTLKQKSVVLNAIQDRGLQVHGLIYDVGSGMLSELETGEPEEVIKARLVSFRTES